MYRLFLLVILIVCSTVPAFAWEGRLKALRELDVKKNIEQLIQTNSCPGCYLRGAYLYGIDLKRANLRGADLTNATWTNGVRCGKGSIGVCKGAEPKEE